MFKNFILKIVELWKAFLYLVFPLNCAGCGKFDVHLCPDCLAIADLPAVEVASRPNLLLNAVETAPAGNSTLKSSCVSGTEIAGSRKNFPVYATGKYQGSLRNIVLNFKNHNRWDIDGFIMQLGENAGKLAIECAGDSIYDSINAKDESEPLYAKDKSEQLYSVDIIPAPSSPKSIRARGRQQTNIIAAGVLRAVQSAFPEIDARINLNLIQTNNSKQENLSYEKRITNKIGSLKAKAPLDRPSILVDDVFTTGSTLQECERVINESGGKVIAAVVLAFARE